MWIFTLRFNSHFKPFRICMENLRKNHSKCKPTVFSGIQPTGVPHLGNYFGAIRKWTSLQNEEKKCIFSVVDLHSITLPQDPETLRNNIHITTACLLACGINPDLSIFFLQSQVPYHAELAWILGCLTTMKRLAHLPQYKEKAGSAENINIGLFTYPLLQSADILMYKANEVPVGEDQIQHIQLCQDLARLFNNKFGKIFPIPDASIDESAARIKSLRQPHKKMSKSDSNIRNRIEITDSPDTIMGRIKEAITDCTSKLTYDEDNRPGVSNLIKIHSLCIGQSCESICEENSNLDTGQYKLIVAEAVIECLKPIRTEFQRHMADPSHIVQILQKGSEKASQIACQTINEVKNVVGLTLSGKS